MGKETKIGLAVVGVLLAVFGALLIRKLMATDAAKSAEAVAVAGLPSSARPRPQMETEPAAREIAAREPRQPLGWARTSREADLPQDTSTADTNTAEPPRSFMPDDGAPRPLNDPGEDQRQETQATAEADQEIPDAPLGSSPFERDQVVDRGGEMRPVRERRENSAAEPPVGNPLRGRGGADWRAGATHGGVRRASAEEPLDPAVDGAGEPQLGATELTAPENPNDFSTADQAPSELSADVRRDEDRAEASSALAEPPAGLPADPAGLPQPAPGGAAMPLENGKYTVQPNDNLWIISEKVYGTGRYFKALYEHNRSRLPRSDRLTVGTTIQVPNVNLLEQNYPALCPKQRRSALVKPRTVQASARGRMAGSDAYIVEEGDTLFDIARFELGKASRWAEIYELNRDTLGEDFDYLQPGTELKMPPKSSATDSMTRQGDDRYQR